MLIMTELKNKLRIWLHAPKDLRRRRKYSLCLVLLQTKSTWSFQDNRCSIHTPKYLGGNLLDFLTCQENLYLFFKLYFNIKWQEKMCIYLIHYLEDKSIIKVNLDKLLQNADHTPNLSASSGPSKPACDPPTHHIAVRYIQWEGARAAQLIAYKSLIPFDNQPFWPLH